MHDAVCAEKSSSARFMSIPNAESAVQRRKTIPEKPNYSLNLWSIMKNCVGRDLTKIPMPVRLISFTNRVLCACFIFPVFYIYRIFIYILSMFLAKMFLKSSYVVFTRVHCIERFPSQGLWLCLWELWHSVINTIHKCHNSHKHSQSPLTSAFQSWGKKLHPFFKDLTVGTELWALLS